MSRRSRCSSSRSKPSATRREGTAGRVRVESLTRQSDSRDQRSVAAVAAKDFFDSLSARADASKTAGMNNSYLFDIEGEGQWLVKVADGKVDVAEGSGDADATITTSAETFDKIVAGEQNPTTAYMTGKLKIKGDMGAAMKLQKLF
ncbi:MAG TPA: SCP2 sterol-binding domain-containing protein [Gaiellaceae bacterium]|nr:SCP2 sterol-binding domain-containing protein [Gaiellaceae bacterium]